MPTGFTHFAYLASHILIAGPNVPDVDQRGQWVTYKTKQNVLAAGAAASATPVTAFAINGVVPAEAEQIRLCENGLVINGAAGATYDLQFGYVSGFTETADTGNDAGAGASYAMGMEFTIPNPKNGGTNLYYGWNLVAGGAAAALSADVDVNGYSVPNGDSA